jgi:hypothetical protein
MATVQVLEEGFRNYIIKVDGTDVETAAKIVDVSALNPPCTRVRLMKATYNLASTAVMNLLWDATSAVTLINLNGSNDADMCFVDSGGIWNNAGAGVTGDVLLSGGAATTPYSLVLSFVKSDPAPQM